MIDWHDNRQHYTPSFLRGELMFSRLGSGWPAIVAFVLGYGAMVPFMNISIVVGPVAAALHGADLAFYVGFIVAGILYYALLKSPRPVSPLARRQGVGTAADDAAR